MNSIMTHHQHGFIKGRSTITNLTEYTSTIMNGMKRHKQVDAIYLDISKAFDSVDTQLMFHKLKLMGLNNQILNWLIEYFDGRQQIVRIDGSITSNPIHVKSGVGQGSPISATLFNLFLFDLPLYIKEAMIHLYADDAKISLMIDSFDQCEQLQDDLNNIVKYFALNKLNLNIKKTKSISFHRRVSLPLHFVYSINASPIERVTHIKDLGVLLDEKLTFKSHIEFIIGKAKSVFAWIKRFAYEFDDPWVIKRLYETFVVPIMEYGSQIWCPTTNIDKNRIESIQKQFLKFALRKLGWRDRFVLPSYKSRLLLFHMNTLEDKRNIHQIIFITSLIFGKINSSNLLGKLNFRVQQRDTRNQMLLNTHFEVINENDPFYCMKKKFNELNNFFDFNRSIETIRNNLKEYYLMQL